MKVWISKYALTQGVYEVQGAECGLDLFQQDIEPGSLCNMSTYYHGEGREWHRTREGAVSKAEEMRKKKISALKKKIAKLEAMKF